MKLRTRMIIILLCAALGIAGAITLTAILPKAMQQRSRALRQADNWEGALAIQDRMLRFFPRNRNTAFAVSETASNFSMNGPSRVYLSSAGGHRSGMPWTPEIREIGRRSAAQLERLIEAQPNSHLLYARYLTMGRILARLGERDAATEALSTAVAGYNEMGSTYNALEAEYVMLRWITDPVERLQRLEELVWRYVEDGRTNDNTTAPHDDGRLYFYRGRAAVEVGELDLARESFLLAMGGAEENAKMANEQIADDDEPDMPVQIAEEDPLYQAARFWLEIIEFRQNPDSPPAASVAGTIRGVPGDLSGGAIHLAPVQGDHYSYGVYSGRDGVIIHPDTIDESLESDGSFTIDGVPPGRYVLWISFPPERLIDSGRPQLPDVLALAPGRTERVEIEFRRKLRIVQPTGVSTLDGSGPHELSVEWEAVAGADHYEVWMSMLERGDNGSFVANTAHPIETEVTGRSLTVRYEGLQPWVRSVSGWGPDGLRTCSILGDVYAGVFCAPVVKAIDADGNALTDSEGFYARFGENYPFFQIEPDFDAFYGALGPAARATAEKRYDDAFRLWYGLLGIDYPGPLPIELPTAVEGLSPADCLATHLALARLYSELGSVLPEYGDRERARRHYEAAARVADVHPELVPDELEMELLGSSGRGSELLRRFPELRTDAPPEVVEQLESAAEAAAEAEATSAD